MKALCVAIIGSLLLSGCSHSMRILNLDTYRAEIPGAENPDIPRLRFNIESDGASPAARLFVGFIREGLQRHPSVHGALVSGESRAGWEPDLIVRIAPRASYSGSVANFFITFPGFLVFMHAWNGFAYEAIVETELLLETVDGIEIDRRAVTTRFDLRHCSEYRGLLASSGWWTPFFGAINLIIGGFMVQYDELATDPFLRAAQVRYGEYVAAQILSMVPGDMETGTGGLPMKREE